MERNDSLKLQLSKLDPLTILDYPITPDEILMGSRVCDNCGKNKDTYGGYSCSKGHFICHSCGSNHVHCPLCGHTLR